MSARPIDPHDAFLRLARSLAFNSPDHGSHRLYERLKGLARAEFQDLTPDEYQRLMRELAQIAGV